jgi:predicted PhzF superfamily epimerase YddE/YHI9
MDLTVVDSFTDRPFAGNPAAVAVLDSFPDEDRMQAIAREMNLSETAFVVARTDGSYDLRWFTPTVEVDLCGHATLASAHVLGGSGTFHTRSGELVCAPAGDGWIEMDFPADPTTIEDAPPTLVGALGLDDASDVRVFARGRSDILVELSDAASVRSLDPDQAGIAALGSRCVIVTASGDVIVTAPGDRPGIDCVSRVFAPNAGIAEDPVTGSAHCTLAGYWGERLGRDQLVGEQASARGGVVRMRRNGARVVLGGQAVTVSQVRLVV